MARKRNDVYVALGELVEEYAGGMTQATVAQLLSDHLGRNVLQSTVSDHMRGQRWGDNPELIGAYAAVLNIPTMVMQRVIGLPSPDDIEEPVQAPTLASLVEADSTLSETAKAHLLNQYGLLQAASAHERSTRKPADTPSATRKKGRRAG